nr:hypothetical protein [Tanacetum cinerariifolium]
MHDEFEMRMMGELNFFLRLYAHTGGNEHNDDIQKSVSPDIHSSSHGDQAREQGDKAVNKEKGKNPVVTITGFRDLNEEFAECINNSSNGVSAAGPLVSAAGLDFTNSTNNFTAADDVGAETDINNMEFIIQSVLFQQLESTKITQLLKLLVICLQL